ncbi:hypothetical protein BGY98DRAFT_1103714 [Russula aff. rugulosa BPL654]|nr:hypothetical protein BGY98DRAFT_1103714 [Russula aff. rugulosa BPL654]
MRPNNQSLHYINIHLLHVVDEDAKHDCTTVLGLLNKNVKALFRRAQARTALQKLSEPHNGVVIVAVLRPLLSIDLQKALKLELNNETVAELARVDKLIVNRKEKQASSGTDTPLVSKTYHFSQLILPLHNTKK